MGDARFWSLPFAAELSEASHRDVDYVSLIAAALQSTRGSGPRHQRPWSDTMSDQGRFASRVATVPLPPSCGGFIWVVGCDEAGEGVCAVPVHSGQRGSGWWVTVSGRGSGSWLTVAPAAGRQWFR